MWALGKKEIHIFKLRGTFFSYRDHQSDIERLWRDCLSFRVSFYRTFKPLGKLSAVRRYVANQEFLCHCWMNYATREFLQRSKFTFQGPAYSGGFACSLSIMFGAWLVLRDQRKWMLHYKRVQQRRIRRKKRFINLDWFKCKRMISISFDLFHLHLKYIYISFTFFLFF